MIHRVVFKEGKTPVNPQAKVNEIESIGSEKFIEQNKGILKSVSVSYNGGVAWKELYKERPKYKGDLWKYFTKKEGSK